MRAKECIVCLVVVGALLGGMMGYGAWGSSGAPVIEGRTADQIDAATVNATTVSGFTLQGQVAYAGIKPLNLAANSIQYLSGNSLLGTYITGASLPVRSPTAGVSVVVASGTGKESAVFYNREATTSGNSLYVMFTSGDTVYSNIDCTPGTSKFVLTGTPLQRKLVAWSTGNSIWVVDAIGNPPVEAD